MDIVEEPISEYEQFPLKDETYGIIGACMNVYNELGNGFLVGCLSRCVRDWISVVEYTLSKRSALSSDLQRTKIE